MSQTRTLTIPFTGTETRELPGGRFLFIKQATAALDITLTDAGGTQSVMQQVGAGARLRRLDSPAWRGTKLTSAGAQTVVIVISDDAEFDIANTVTVSGAVTAVDLPSSAVATPAAVTFATASASSIAANPARRRIAISADPGNAGPIYVQSPGSGAGRGYQLQGGITEWFNTMAALDVRNDTGSNATYSTFEES